MRLLIFLGAGVSIPSGLPTAMELTARVLDLPPASDESRARLVQFLKLLQTFDTADRRRPGPFISGGASGAIFRGPVSTYEDLFFLCQELSLWSFGQSDSCLATPFIETLEREAGDLLDSIGVPARLRELALLGRPGCELIESVAVRELSKPYVRGLERLIDLAEAPAAAPLAIATLNHDLHVEQCFADRGLALTNGFGPPDGDIRWSDDGVYDRDAETPAIYKLHGSIDWRQFSKAGASRIAMLQAGNLAAVTDAAGMPITPDSPRPRFLSGLNKAVDYNVGFFADVHYRFWRLLRECDRVIMCGYSWGDSSISLQIEGWLDRSPANRLVLLHPRFSELVDHSFVLARSERDWRSRGKLHVIPTWLSEVSFSELVNALA